MDIRVSLNAQSPNPGGDSLNIYNGVAISKKEAMSLGLASYILADNTMTKLFCKDETTVFIKKGVPNEYVIYSHFNEKDYSGRLIPFSCRIVSECAFEQSINSLNDLVRKYGYTLSPLLLDLIPTRASSIKSSEKKVKRISIFSLIKKLFLRILTLLRLKK